MSGCMAFDCAQESLPGHHYCAGHVPPSVVIDHLRAQLAEGAGDVVRATRDVAIVRAELVTKERNELRARVAELEAERDRDFERGYDQGVCEALSTMSAEDAAYCRKRFPNWDKAWKAYLAATPKEPR